MYLGFVSPHRVEPPRLSCFPWLWPLRACRVGLRSFDCIPTIAPGVRACGAPACVVFAAICQSAMTCYLTIPGFELVASPVASPSVHYGGWTLAATRPAELPKYSELLTEFADAVNRTMTPR